MHCIFHIFKMKAVFFPLKLTTHAKDLMRVSWCESKKEKTAKHCLSFKGQQYGQLTDDQDKLFDSRPNLTLTGWRDGQVTSLVSISVYSFFFILFEGFY